MADPIISKHGTVLVDGRKIGRVWKGTRTYSPPIHKGSRIVKYHKQVPCWWAVSIDGAHDFNRSTRKECVKELVEIASRME